MICSKRSCDILESVKYYFNMLNTKCAVYNIFSCEDHHLPPPSFGSETHVVKGGLVIINIIIVIIAITIVIIRTIIIIIHHLLPRPSCSKGVKIIIIIFLRTETHVVKGVW